MTDYGRVRRLPASLYRRLAAGFSEAAHKAAHRELTLHSPEDVLDGYRGDRDLNGSYLDALITAQIGDLLAAASIEAHGESDLRKLIVQMSHTDRDYDRRHLQTMDDAAMASRSQLAEDARAVANELKRLAKQAEAIELAAACRLEDHDTHLARREFMQARRGS